MNTRRVSLLNVFNKILEKLVYSRVVSFLKKNRIIYTNQFGFRSNHSTNHALINVLDKLYKGLDKGEMAIGVYLDVEKAFDCINHSILLDKLQYNGIRGVAWKWLSNYPQDRKQYVSVNNYNSVISPISCGVPQGSVLGPLLFLLYINDIQFVDTRIVLNLFADDTCLFVFDKDPESLFLKSNMSLDSINKWFTANKLKLSISKCVYTVFNLTKKKSLNIRYDLSINSTKLIRVNSTKYLGVYIDEDLTWQNHIHYIINKIL